MSTTLASTNGSGNMIRSERLKTAIMTRKGSFPGTVNPLARSVALWRASMAGGSRVQVRASYLHELVRLAPIEIEPDWTLAGNHLPTAHIPLLRPDPDDPEHVVRIRELGVSEEQLPAVRDAVVLWEETARRAIEEASSDHPRRGGCCDDDPRKRVFIGIGWAENHSVRDYAKAIRIGFNGIRKEIEQEIAKADTASPDLARKESFWGAALRICDAAVLLGARYAEEARALADRATSPDEKGRLWRIAEACAQVPARGARTLAEATQSLWLLHILTCGEDGIGANSLGRLDQILYPYYVADVAAGRLSRDGAIALMEELACRLYLEYDVQAITLGGLDRNGHDAANDLSYIILEATRNVGFMRDLSVRLHKNSPERFVRLACELMARGGGIPFVFNDDCFVPALTGRGIRLEDARGYAPIGCIELTVPGRANPRAVSGWFNSLKCLELAMFDGRDPETGTQWGPRTGTLQGFAAFEDFFAAYCQQVETFAERMVDRCNAGELAQREAGPLPCLSVMTDDCIQRGRDITDGGAIYNYHSVCFLGTANTADAMMALKMLVFDEARIPPAELLDALRCNFEGREDLRQTVLNEAPKYGNDNPEVDELARRVADHFITLMDHMASPLGGRYFVHLFSFLQNIGFGKTVGATPDGRLAQEPLAYSLSAHQGRDVKGVTAMLNSLSRLPHHRAAGASAAIVEIDPVLIEGPQGVERLTQLTRAAVAMGVGQLQWNVTTVERLKKAQQDPERYGNIAVRVAGYSQMFRLIDRELQDHIIARTKHRY
ncbi:MAG: pyruvate formate lyase family protein [Planctomycetota bacterium]